MKAKKAVAAVDDAPAKPEAKENAAAAAAPAAKSRDCCHADGIAIDVSDDGFLCSSMHAQHGFAPFLPPFLPEQPVKPHVQ